MWQLPKLHMQCPPKKLLAVLECSRPMLSSRAAASHMWPLSTWKVVGVIDKMKF